MLSLKDMTTRVHMHLGGPVSFIHYFNTLENGRTDINITYDFLDVVFLPVVALLSGTECWQAIQRFGDAKLSWLRQHREFYERTLRRGTFDETDKGHGRFEQRRYIQLDVIPWLASPHRGLVCAGH